jgi:hypothetical protein
LLPLDRCFASDYVVIPWDLYAVQSQYGEYLLRSENQDRFDKRRNQRRLI